MQQTAALHGEIRELEGTAFGDVSFSAFCDVEGTRSRGDAAHIERTTSNFEDALTDHVTFEVATNCYFKGITVAKIDGTKAANRVSFLIAIHEFEGAVDVDDDIKRSIEDTCAVESNRTCIDGDATCEI